MKRTVSFFFFLCLFRLIAYSIPVQPLNDGELNRIIRLPELSGTIYQLLEKVTDESGFLFIYDSDVLNNEQAQKIKAGEYSIKDAIYQITGNEQLILRLIGNHILLQLPEEKNPREISTYLPQRKEQLIIDGTLLDKYTHEPIAFGTVGILNTSIGTITNQDGEFRIRIPDSLQNVTLQFSHLGYEPYNILSDILTTNQNNILLEPKIISIQEIVVRLMNGSQLVKEMIDNRDKNYAKKPVYFTSFYREGVGTAKNFVNLTEAIFKIYKSPLYSYSTDQVKLIKMRKIINTEEKDTVVTKMRSGIQASLSLDLIKDIPEFISMEENNPYTYLHTDITFIEDRMVNVVSFEQHKGIYEPLYKGLLYIDAENHALVMAEFEVNPAYIKKATSMIIERKSKGLSITPEKISYTVSYKPWNGVYYINHVRGDLKFKAKQRKQRYNPSVHTWFEMVTCVIETEDVNRFSRSEIVPKTSVFSDIQFTYDDAFWENFNIILPEEELSEAIRKISSKIEETGY